jgi:HSP20 family protein
MNPTVSLTALLSRLSRLPGDLGELIGQVASKPRRWWVQSFPYPVVNIREEADAFQVEAEVPGVRRDEMEVLIRNGTELTLRTERKPAPSESGTWIQQERCVGRFQRDLMLPAPVDAEKVQARLENGVLCLVLPKAESVKAHRIPVHGGNGKSVTPVI